MEAASTPLAPPAHLSQSPNALRETTPSSATGSKRGSSQGPHPQTGAPQPSRPPKKPKLTPAEKAVANAEKERKAADKLLEKSQKEEEKRLKDAEKKSREEEREEKRRQRDLEKATKEEEKRVKEVEKAKKEKAQLRLSAFFAKPSASSHGSTTSSRRNSVGSDDGPTINAPTDGPTQEPLASEFDRTFPPFFIKQHTTVAYRNPASLDVDEVLKAMSADESNSNPRKRKASALSELIPRKSRRTAVPRAIKDIVSDLRGTNSHPVDSTKPYPPSSSLLHQLGRIPVKYLRFAEDVRPPYFGTFTRIPNPHMSTRVCRNPFTRGFDTVNYEYDSEAEWEEPEEGEDLDSEGEEEAGDDDDADDMDGFLEDDEVDAAAPKRRHVMSDLSPICTGLLWDPDARDSPSTFDMRPFCLEILNADFDCPIDPYSTKFWEPTTTSVPATNLMPPPRHPLLPGQTTGNILPDITTNLTRKDLSPSTTTTITTTTSIATKSRSSTAKPMPPELLEDFKQAVSGSDLTKTGLIEVLKKKFPQITKATVQDTLAAIATRVGKKESEKIWVLV